MSSECCQTTEDGSVYCATTGNKQCESVVYVSPPETESLWKRTRSLLAFGVACAASPCCTVPIVPIALSLLAGTPFAVWAAAHLGWVYGGLTLLSVASLLMGLRWMRTESPKQNPQSSVGFVPLQEIEVK